MVRTQSLSVVKALNLCVVGLDATVAHKKFVVSNPLNVLMTSSTIQILSSQMAVKPRVAHSCTAQSMAKSTECVLFFGSEIRVQWTQTQDGSISINLRHAVSGIAKADPLRLHSHGTDTIVFCAGPGEQPEQGQEFADGTSLDQGWHGVLRRDSSLGRRNNDSLDADCREREDGVAEVARKMGQKLEKRWETMRESIESNSYQWSTDPSTFFGTKVFTSRGAWSFASLCDADERLHRLQSPFHKANLSDCLKRSMKDARRLCPGFVERNGRSSLLSAIYPGFNELTRRDKNPLYKKLERYVEHGDVISIIATINPGLLLTVAPFLATDDFATLTKRLNVRSDFTLPWLSETIIRESVKFGPLALGLLAYAQADPQPRGAKRNAQFQDDLPGKRRQLTVDAISKRPPLPTPESSQETLPAQRSAQRYLSSSSTFGCSDLCDESGVVLSDERLGDSAYLYLCLHFSGGAVPESLFKVTQSQHSRRSENQADEEAIDFDAGVGRRLLSIASDESRLRRALVPFHRHELSEPWVYSPEMQLGSNVSQSLSTEEKRKWCIRNLDLMCFGLSSRALRELPTERTVQSLIPLVSHVLQALGSSSIPENVRAKVSETLLAVSHLSNHIRQRVLPVVVELVNDGSPLHLQAELAYAQSVASRLLAEFERSERFIHDFCCRCEKFDETCIPKFYRQSQPSQVDRRLNALYGRLHRSHLENLVQCEDYESAIEQVDYWQVPANPSPVENLVRPSLMVTVCKIFRSQGLFLDVRERLELCLHYPGGANQIQILCSLADVYCDLAKVGGDSSWPKVRDALDRIRHLIDPELEKRDTTSKAFRRLKVSQIEMDIQACRYEDAYKSILATKKVFRNLFNLDVSDQLLHVRVLVASARIHHIASEFVKATQEWKTALEHVQKYASFEGEGFTYAAINLSLSLAYLKTGDRSKASTSFDHAARLLRLGVEDYWIPTLWAWAEATLLEIQSASGWKPDWTQRSALIRRAIEKDRRLTSLWQTNIPNMTQ